MTKRILIVDDEDDIRTIIQASLEEMAGWQTTPAASGLEGLEIARTEAIDAILLDISMPDMDGFQIFAALQDNPATRSIPVIVLTSKVLASDRSRFANLKIAGVITKPFNPLTIWQEISEILHWPL